MRHWPAFDENWDTGCWMLDAGYWMADAGDECFGNSALGFWYSVKAFCHPHNQSKI
jgi:hypothetical protein